MKSLSGFLARFQSLTPPDNAIRKSVAKAVETIAGVPVTFMDVTLRNNVAFVKCSSVAKSVIRGQRMEILSEIVREQPKARDLVRDIR